MQNKKALEIQFNWMFVLIAGAAILIFFTVIVVKQKNLSETSSEVSVLKGVESIINGAAVSADTINAIDIPNSNIEISCNEFSIGKASKKYQSLVLFAPSLIKGNKLITQTLSFDVPFKSTNFLYMTSPQVRYILITDSNQNNKNLAKEVNKYLPASLEKEHYETVPAIKDKNDYKVKLVIFGNININNLDLSNLKPNSDVTAVKVNGDTGKGTLEFYKKNAGTITTDTSVYVGKSSLVGSVYSETKDIYECNMQNAFRKLNLVAKTYIERTNKLKKTLPKPGRETQCNLLYEEAKALLRKIDDKSSTFKFNAGDRDEIASAANDLNRVNKDLQRFSCVLIY